MRRRKKQVSAAAVVFSESVVSRSTCMKPFLNLSAIARRSGTVLAVAAGLERLKFRGHDLELWQASSPSNQRWPSNLGSRGSICDGHFVYFSIVEHHEYICCTDNQLSMKKCADQELKSYSHTDTVSLDATQKPAFYEPLRCRIFTMFQSQRLGARWPPTWYIKSL